MRGGGGGRDEGYLAPSSALPSPSVLPSSSVFRSSVLSFCSFFLRTHFTTISTRMTTARKPPTDAPTITATVESRSGGSKEEEKWSWGVEEGSALLPACYCSVLDSPPWKDPKHTPGMEK